MIIVIYYNEIVKVFFHRQPYGYIPYSVVTPSPYSVVTPSNSGPLASASALVARTTPS